jgi:hypothetical protein
MAPNVQRIRLLATPLAHYYAGRTTTTFLSVAKDYVAPSSSTTMASSEAYWLWKTITPVVVDLFSADRITKNLLLDVGQRNARRQQQHQQQQMLNPAHDQYWAGQPQGQPQYQQQQEQPHGSSNPPQHELLQPTMLKSYCWDEASWYGNKNNKTTGAGTSAGTSAGTTGAGTTTAKPMESDSDDDNYCYWSEPFPARHYDDATAPISYWDEHHYALQQWSDRYWYNLAPTTTTTTIAGNNYTYWQWKPTAATHWTK